MDDSGEWVDYDPADISTHPEEGSEVKLLFANGRHTTAIYSRAAGGFSNVETLPPETLTLQKRWRYAES